MMRKVSLDCALFKMVDIQAIVGRKKSVHAFPSFLYNFDGIRSVKVNINIKYAIFILFIVLVQPALIM